ncbi:hypothetical protein BDV97DRAFT_55104 [Delphinella strobiligena]|nr:hypothetical protein BDV97DRAFT_55104 [Delphinella strobiligena]
MLIGYGSSDLSDMECEDYIIGYQVNGTSWNAVIKPKDKNPVKHTRTASRNTKVLDANIGLEPALGDKKQGMAINRFLREYYREWYKAAAKVFESHGSVVKSRNLAETDKAKAAEEAKGATIPQGWYQQSKVEARPAAGKSFGLRLEPNHWYL